MGEAMQIIGKEVKEFRDSWGAEAFAEHGILYRMLFNEMI